MALSQNSNTVQLKELCQERLGQTRIILASNRGPFEYYFTEDRRLQARRGSGGVVTALSCLGKYVDLSWVASAMGGGDRQAAERAQGNHIKAPLVGENLYLRFVVTHRNVYHKYYSVFCNPLLWFLQHYMWNSSRTPNINNVVYDAWENGYIPTNQAFAQAVIEEATENKPSPFVMLHDYHLYLAAAYIRSEMPHLIIQHFTHIPWPAPDYWQLLPLLMRQAICNGLCAADIVGFQTRRDAQNFLHCCECFLDDADVDYRQSTVWIGSHLTQVNAYPVSVDVDGLNRTVSSARAQEYGRKIQPLCGEHTIVRVDRAEPSKNIVRGFKAFNMLLERYPQFVGKVKFLAFLVPTRTNLRQYQRYMTEVTEIVDDINSRYGNGGWHPIEIFYENNYVQAIAGMRFYDVLLVNAVIDGMNLVAKEGPTVNARDGVLILSESVGAHEQLGDYALSVAPAVLEATTEALYTALTMPAEERSSRALALKKLIREEDVTRWIYRQLDDLINLSQERAVPVT